MSTPKILPNQGAVIAVLVHLVCALLLSGCQPAPSPAPKLATDTPIVAENIHRTATPTRKQPLAPTRTPVATSDLGIQPSELDSQQVQFWHALNGGAAPAVTELVREFNSTNPWGIVVEARDFGNYDTLDEEVAAALAEDRAPDLVSAYTYQPSSWESGGEVLAKLDDYIDDPEYGLDAEEQADFYPAFWEQQDGTRRTSIPALRSGQVLYYNQSWADELGFDAPPSTPEEFREQVCAAAQANREDDDPDNNQTGGWIISSDYPAVLAWLYAFGSPVTRADRRGYQLNTEEVEQAFTFLRQLYEEGCAWLPESLPAEDEFAQRKGLLAAGSLTGIPHQQTAMRRAANRDRWTVLPFPSASGKPVISAYGPSYMVLKSTPEKQLAAWLFARWLSSPINQAELASTTSSFPLRASTLDYLLNYRPTISPQWGAAANLISTARAEPEDASWSEVRWAISDAGTQLFRWYFTMEQLPATVQLLDQTAAELYQRSR